MLGLLMSLSLVYPLSMLVSCSHKSQLAASMVKPQYSTLRRLSLQARAELRVMLAPSFLDITYAFAAGQGHRRGKGEEVEGDNVHHGLTGLGPTCWYAAMALLSTSQQVDCCCNPYSAHKAHRSITMKVI